MFRGLFEVYAREAPLSVGAAIEEMEPTATTSHGFIEQLCRSYQAPLHCYLAQMVGSQDIGQELAQQCFEYVHRTYRASRVMFPRAMLFKVATKFALMHLRRRRVEGRYWGQPVDMEYVKEVVPDHDSLLPDREAMAEQVRDRLVAAIKELRPAYRRVFVMALLQSNNRKEIATAVGVSEKRLDKRMTKAIKTCRARLVAEGIQLTDLLSVVAIISFGSLLGVR
ncbi:MAG: RNA polymerase sigma factor [Steroidobacteraceae bacterium]